ncbi:MAG: DinB family protein [Candidatus Rokuibacteriota bacterium]
MATRKSDSLAKWRRQAVKRIQATRRATLAFIARLPEAELLRPHTHDQWSVRDVLGHLTSCDEETVRRFKLIARGRGDRVLWFNMAIANEFNARTVAQTRRLGLAALLRRMAKAHADVIDWLQRLPVESLEDSSHAYTVVSWLPVPGWRHEQHHMSEVKAWWQKQRPRRSSKRSAKSPARRGQSF